MQRQIRRERPIWNRGAQARQWRECNLDWRKLNDMRYLFRYQATFMSPNHKLNFHEFVSHLFDYDCSASLLKIDRKIVTYAIKTTCLISSACCSSYVELKIRHSLFNSSSSLFRNLIPDLDVSTWMIPDLFLSNIFTIITIFMSVSKKSLLESRF